MLLETSNMDNSLVLQINVSKAVKSSIPVKSEIFRLLTFNNITLLILEVNTRPLLAIPSPILLASPIATTLPS